MDLNSRYRRQDNATVRYRAKQNNGLELDESLVAIRRLSEHKSSSDEMNGMNGTGKGSPAILVTQSNCWDTDTAINTETIGVM